MHVSFSAAYFVVKSRNILDVINNIDMGQYAVSLFARYPGLYDRINAVNWDERTPEIDPTDMSNFNFVMELRKDYVNNITEAKIFLGRIVTLCENALEFNQDALIYISDSEMHQFKEINDQFIKVGVDN